MKIICIGRNYAAHAAELHHQTGLGTEAADEPLWFLKPDTALLRNNDPFYVPDFSQEVHYECELVVRIDRVGKCIEERIRLGLPWERAKAFDRSAALAPRFIPLEELGGDVQRLRFELELNGQVRQQGDTSLMLYPVNRLIACVSRYLTLRMGDLLFTGTPAGVGPVRPGDTLRATLEGHEQLCFDIR